MDLESLNDCIYYGVDVAYNITFCQWGRNGNGVRDLTFLLFGKVADLYLEAYTG